MGLFKKRLDPEEIARLKAELGSMRERLDEHDATTADLSNRLGSIDAANMHLTEQVGAVGELTEHVSKLAERPDPQTVADRVEAIASQITDLDARVTAVSTELANQLSELSGEIDHLAARPPGDGPGTETIGELREGQVRLAGEQARYQIAFREDLARLAEQLRKTRG